MKQPFQHIAILLLAVFSVTIIPFNALHHHAEDEHAAFVHSHAADTQHHCELDDHFCQTDLGADCGHEYHIQSTIEKCFACDYHFIEAFDTPCSTELAAQDFRSGTSNKVVADKLLKAILFISNKGPPRLV